MKKEEIYVVIDSEEKRKKAVQILTDAGQDISPLKGEMDVDFMNYILRYTETLKHWFIGRSIESRTQITLDRLEQLLKPELNFPREMMVWNDGLEKDKEFVQGIFEGRYMVEVGKQIYHAYSNASEIEPQKPTLIQEVEEKAKELVDTYSYWMYLCTEFLHGEDEGSASNECIDKGKELAAFQAQGIADNIGQDHPRWSFWVGVVDAIKNYKVVYPNQTELELEG